MRECYWHAVNDDGMLVISMHKRRVMMKQPRHEKEMMIVYLSMRQCLGRGKKAPRTSKLHRLVSELMMEMISLGLLMIVLMI